MNMTGKPIQQLLPSAAFTVLACLLLIFGGGTSAFGQPIGKRDYEQLCAPCHGIDGTGKGRDLTEVNPPDLTTLSSKNGGKFPFDQVYLIVDGRKLMDSHRRFAMPFWGTHLQQQGQPGSDAAVRQRITEIVRYVETMQKK